MPEKSTKAYSNKQEKMIQDYLGWKRVSASGARPFHPGDVRSDEWLSECKTHTKIVRRIDIVKKVWDKISIEATSSFKRPILFVDNGSQNIDHTWCVFQERFADFSKVKRAHDYITYFDSYTKISFDHEQMQSVIGDGECATILISGKSLLLMRLTTFKSMLELE